MRIVRILLGAVGVLLLLVVALIGASYLFLQTDAGKGWLAARLEAALSGPDRSIRLGRLEGGVPFDLRLADAELLDRKGPWLALRDVRLTIAARDLLAGRLTIERLTAAEIHVERAPEPAAPAEPSTGPFELRLPHLPIDVALRSFEVPDLLLAPALLGEPVALSVAGHAALDDSGAEAALKVRRTDGQEGHADLTLALAAGDPGRLRVDLDLAEPTGALADALLARDDRAPVQAKLAGEGPLADWHGRLDGTVGDLARLGADLTLGVGKDGERVAASGTLAAAPLLPPDIAPLVGDNAAFRLAARRHPDGSVTADEVALDAAAAHLTASGGIASDKTLNATARLVADDLGKLAPLAGGADLSGRGTVTATLSGTTDRPRVEASLDAADPRFAGNGAAHVAARLSAAPDGDLGAPGTRFALDGGGRVEGIVTASGALPAGLGDAVDWTLAGSADEAAERVVLDKLTVSGPGVTLDGTATATNAGQGIDGSFHLVADDLARFAALTGQPLAGAGTIELRVSRAAGDGVLSAKLDGDLRELRTGIPAADALLGPHVTLKAEAKRAADGSTSVDNLELTAANASVIGRASLPPGADRVAAHLVLDLPRLAPLGSALGTKLAGRATLTADASGPFDALGLKAVLDGADLRSGEARLDRLQARLDGAWSDQPGGKLDAEFRAADLAGTLSGEARLRDGGKLLDVPRLRLAAAGTTVEASLRTALDTLLTDGTVSARAPDLAPWSKLAGMKLAGRADLKATLTTKNGQTIEATLDGAKLAAVTAPGSRLALERIALTARLDDLLGKPTGKAELTASRAALPGGEVSSLRARLDAPRPGKFGFNADAKGTFHEAFDLAAAGEAAIDGGNADLRLTRLAGHVADAALQLRRPLTASRHGEDVAFDGLQFALGSGQISGSGRLKRDTLQMNLQARRLPVGLAARFAGREGVAGEIGFDLDVGGTLDRPEGRFIVSGSGLRFAAATHPDLPPLSMSTQAVWRSGRVDLKGRVDAPRGEAIGFSGSAPLVLQRTPSLTVVLPPQEAVSLRLEGDGHLESLADLLPLGEDTVRGAYHLDVSVRGTVAAPEAAGKLTLSDGRYENLASGVVLSNIAVVLEGDGDRFVLRRFSANDGGKGTLQGNGGVVLSATPGPAFNVTAQMRNFRVVRRDEANANASGDFWLVGTLAEPKVTARVRVEDAELRIPDRLPPSVKRLDVVEINSKTGQMLAPQKKAAEKEPALPAALDITVDLPGQVFVRGRGLDSEWKGRLQIGGTSDAPQIVGKLETVRGSFSILGKSFQLAEGTITFDGGAKIDPAVNITAQTNSSGVTAQVIIGGTASEPTIRLTSTPEMPQDEVLARILFNKGMGQITPVQGLQLAQAAASLAGGGPGLLDRLRGKLGLDRLDVGSGDQQTGTGSSGSSANGAGSATISAGKYLADGVYVGVDQGVTGQSKAKVEIEVLPNVTVDTETGSRGSTGVGLNWKLDY